MSNERERDARDWQGAEEWMPLAWELCANECGEEACNELVWEGGPIPEPWGDRWLKYEHQAKDMIAMVRKSLQAVAADAVGGEAVPEGYALVPVEPTPKMAKAAADAWFDCGSKLYLNKAAAAIKAALSAAPKRETPGACREKGTGEFCPAPQEPTHD